MSSKLFKSTIVVGFMTLLSRILGLLREMVFATQFGATGSMDAFLVAFKIPNFMRRLFAEGAFAQAFVPVFAAQSESGDREQMRQTVRFISGTLAVIVLLVALVGMATSMVWVSLFAPGFVDEPQKFDLAQQMLRITFPYIFFVSLTALAGGVLNSLHKFAVPAVTPVLLNLAIIGSVLGLSSGFQDPVVAAAYGVLMGGIIQLLWQLPFLYRVGMLVKPVWGWSQPVVRRVIKLMVPVIFGASVAQISLLFDTIFASFLKTGSVSWLYYSDRLVQFPLGVFGVALSTVVLPTLSKQHVSDQRAYNRSLDWALRLVIVLGIPAAVGIAVLSGPMVATFFGYDAFSTHDVIMSRNSLVAFAVGLVFFIAVKVLVSAFYARQQMKTPVKIAAVSMLCNLLFNAILIWPLAHVGLALATSLGALVNVSLLYWQLRKQHIYQPESAWGRTWVATSIACLGMVSLLYWLSPNIQIWATWTAGQRIWHLLLLILSAKVVYVLLLYLCGIRKQNLTQG